MMEEARDYSTGDWIVHSHYGIGKVEGIEVKRISGQETSYFRVRTSDSTYWIPIDQLDSSLLRPLSTPEEIDQAIATLKRPAKEMSSNHKIRQSLIQNTLTHNSPSAFAQLIRDLRARRKAKGMLNSTELNAFHDFKQRLIEEWAIVKSANTGSVATRLDSLLDRSQTSAD